MYIDPHLQLALQIPWAVNFRPLDNDQFFDQSTGALKVYGDKVDQECMLEAEYAPKIARLDIQKPELAHDPEWRAQTRRGLAKSDAACVKGPKPTWCTWMMTLDVAAYWDPL